MLLTSSSFRSWEVIALFENILLLDVLKNPVLLAALIALIRNVGGYVTSMLGVKKYVPWEPVKFGETLALYETFFVALSAVPSLPVEWIAIVAISVDVVRSFKKAIALGLTKMTAA